MSVRGAALAQPSGIRAPTILDMGLVALLGVLWGSAFPAIKVGVETLRPFDVVLLRVGIGAAFLCAWVFVVGGFKPNGQASWGRLVVMAALNTVVPFLLISWAEQRVQSGVAALLMGAGPFFALIVSHLTTNDDKLTWPKLAGVALGFSGVLTLIGVEAVDGFSGNLVPSLAIFAANLCYVAAGAMIRHVHGFTRETMALGNLLIGLALLAPLLLLVGLPNTAALDGEGWAAILWLGVVGSGASYVLRFHIANTVGYATMAMASYVMPVAGVGLGWLVLGERFSPATWIALALVLAGFAVARLRARA